jgi:hypothetical protein
MHSSIIISALLLFAFGPRRTGASDDAYYYANNNYNYNQKSNQYGDDDYNQKNRYGDDDAYAAADDYQSNQQNMYNAQNAYGDDYFNHQDDAYRNEQQAFQYNDDDSFHWNTNVGFDGVSVLPLSCVNYNNGHMIKFQLFDAAHSYQCHFAEISTFVVSISHFMRAYFNYKALELGKDFELPADAAYLNVSTRHPSLYSRRPLPLRLVSNQIVALCSAKVWDVKWKMG